MCALGTPQVVYSSSPYMMPAAASVSAMPMTSYTTGLPMAYSNFECCVGWMESSEVLNRFIM